MGPLRLFMEPKSLALITGSTSEGLGAAVAGNLLAGQSNAGIYVISKDTPQAREGQGYRNVGDLPIVPDLGIICTPAATVVEALDEAGQKGIKAAVVITADPQGSDPETPLKAALRIVGKRHGCRFLGPGSAGINMPAGGINASWIGKGLALGNLALVSQSGSIAASVAQWAILHGIGLSRVISVGDEADVGLEEILAYLAADIRTTGILLYLRKVVRGRAFVSSARAAARIKPVLVLKPRLLASLSANDEPRVDPDAVYDAVFRRAGLLRVYDTEEWFDAAENLGRLRQRNNGKLAIISNGSGPGCLAAAQIAAEGLLACFQEKTTTALEKLIPAGVSAVNPIDLGRDATSEHYAEALAALGDDVNVAAALVISAPSPVGASADLPEVLAHAAKHTSMQVFACWFGGALDREGQRLLGNANVALYDKPEKAARAFIHLGRYRRNQEELRQVPASRRRQLAGVAAEMDATAPVSGGALLLTDEKESAAVLSAYGTIWRAIKAKRALLEKQESIAVLRAFGFPVAQRLEEDLHSVPLSLSLLNDSTFGRVIFISVAGRHLVTLPPLNEELTQALAVAAASALQAATGIDVRTRNVQNMVIRMADLAVELPEIVALVVSSVALHRDELIIIDAQARVAAPDDAGNHLCIHPYPRELEERLQVKDGREVLIRPIRIEDIPLYHKMLNAIPARDLFLRFCSAFGDLTQAIPTELLANLIHFDYSRDMTFIALGAGRTGEVEALGVVDAFISPSREQAEYSILVHSDMAGTGLGKSLMTKIIDYCRVSGVAELFGLVLCQNARMLGLCTRLGFTRASEEPDEDMVKVVLPLQSLQPTDLTELRQAGP